MKKNEIIELNGKEYTLELNRDSFLQIDKLCNVEKSMEIINKKLYDYIDDIDDNFNPLEDMGDLNEEQLEKNIKEKEEVLYRLIERSMFLWLYPNHKLTITEVKELVRPYLEDSNKAEWLSEKIGGYLQECVELRETYSQEQKNLEALANKKN